MEIIRSLLILSVLISFAVSDHKKTPPADTKLFMLFLLSSINNQ